MLPLFYHLEKSPTVFLGFLHSNRTVHALLRRTGVDSTRPRKTVSRTRNINKDLSLILVCTYDTRKTICFEIRLILLASCWFSENYNADKHSFCNSCIGNSCGDSSFECKFPFESRCFYLDSPMFSFLFFFWLSSS